MAHAQNKNIIKAELNGDTKEIRIQHELSYTNTSNHILQYIYLNDWAHAYSDKNTGLAQRFGEEFKKSLHLARDQERGHTTIISAVDDEYRGLKWTRTREKDIIRVELNRPLFPGKTATLFLTYVVKLPHSKFTSYGYDDKGYYYLKDWYLSPSVYDGDWHIYSNKNLDDIHT
ncbi:MAG: metalloprotease, partial [Flavobacteriaceae bacterium]